MTQSPERIFRRRVAAGLLQNELARRAQVSTATMSRIEGGIMSARPDVLCRLALVLGCEVTDLMPDETASDSAA